MYNIMKLLINNQFYSSLEEAQTKIDVFYATSRITDEQYVELTELVVSIYEVAPPLDEPTLPPMDEPIIPPTDELPIPPADKPITPPEPIPEEAPNTIVIDEFV